MRSGVLQVHPSARCNLRCRHCDSSSGPDRTDALDVALLRDVVDDAVGLGYDTLAVSGGEPLLYRDLAGLLRHARDAGMRTTLVTNGTLANRARLEPLVGLVDVMAFSLDGPPEVHNRVRRSPSAFARLVCGLTTASHVGIPHGLLYSVTASSWPYVAWAADFAADHGCALFQVHAVEAVGRARTEMADEVADRDVLDLAFVAAAMAGEAHADQMALQLDLVHRSQLERPAADTGVPAERPVILVVEEDGVVVPHAHGFPRSAAVADLRRERLGDAWPRFTAEVQPALTGLVDATRAGLLAGERRVFDWYAELTAAAADHWSPSEPAVPVGAVPVSVG
jgi:Fe-coproporphyrin III synthase